MSFDIPIAFCIYNRPETTRRVFEQIRSLRPKKLFVIADGPKADDERDQELVDETLKVLQRLDWKCDVVLIDSLVNLGCRNRIATGLTQAFEQSERLVILEDDCLPSPSFFSYCRELLDRYEDDPGVMMISGDRFAPKSFGESACYFSRWTHIWGWASWRRAWEKFDVEMNNWPEIQDGRVLHVESNHREASTWERVFDQAYRQEIDTWDFAWQYACWTNDGLVAIPPQNLVTNIGFGNEATHTRDANSWLANIRAFDLDRIEHPKSVERNIEADDWTFDNVFAPAFGAEEEKPILSMFANGRNWWKSNFSQQKRRISA